MFHAPEEYRIKDGPKKSDARCGNNGAFEIRPLISGRLIYCICSDGMGWEHVSVSISIGRGRSKTPNWDEMCYIKDIFWDDEDIVMQLHPKKSEYVNIHPNVLHLWRPIDKEIPMPFRYVA